VRALVPAAARPLWLLGPSTRPADAAERLRALGLTTPTDRVATLHALVLLTPPPAVDGVEVRTVDTFDDFLASLEVQWDAFGTPAERRAGRGELEAVFRAWRAGGHLTSVLGLVDGRPAASGRLVRSPHGGFLIGGCVAPWARGRGLYRALVRARFEQAAAWGAPALGTHAAPHTSLPILLRLGFEEVCLLERLEDPRA
jgi:GNAT superfamily N-acetyltransferase